MVFTAMIPYISNAQSGLSIQIIILFFYLYSKISQKVYTAFEIMQERLLPM